MCFVYPIEASFIRTDLELLSTFCDVVPLHFRGAPDYARLFREITRSDLVFCWFALDFAAVAGAVAKATARKYVVVAGGWDITGLPEISYGRLLYMRGRLEARVGLRLADRVLAFSDWSAEAIREFCPRAKVQRVYLGIDLNAFRPAAKEDLVLCIANVTRENVTRKGLHTLVRAAAEVPETRFLLVGRCLDDSAEQLRAIAPKNLEITGWLPDPELRDLLSRARVYVQPSYAEGFGMAIAEAMAAGCVPVVTRAGAIPEVVGDTGFYAQYGDASGLAKTIRTALRSDRGSEARNRAAGHFRIERRLELLRAVVRELLGQTGSSSPVAARNALSPRTEVGP